MKIAVLRERAESETRVAMTPETAGKLVGLGAEVSVETRAGERSRFGDDTYEAAGATIAATAKAAVSGADVVLCVRRPSPGDLAGITPGTLLIGSLDPYGHEAEIAALAGTGAAAFTMEFLPRITRAQTMDVLSSQANLAGYQAVIEAAAVFGRAMPMMMTAAGTVRPAKAFVMGAGVAGLQAIATARRLGAVVSGTDVRPAAKEQVESLGAKFIAVEDEEFRQAETAGGYAKEMSADYRAKQAALTAEHLAKQDIVVTTALIPGKSAPKLIDKAMVESMAPGSVIVDLAAERGGNVELTQPDEIIDHGGVKIIGFSNMQGRIPTTASQLYARNLVAFLEPMIDKQEKTLAVDWADELIKATLLTRDGAVVHPNIVVPAGSESKPAAPAKAAASGRSKTASTSSGAAKGTRTKSSAKPAAPAKSGAAGKTVKATKPKASGATSKTASPKPAAKPARKTQAKPDTGTDPDTSTAPKAPGKDE